LQGSKIKKKRIQWAGNFSVKITLENRKPSSREFRDEFWGGVGFKTQSGVENWEKNRGIALLDKIRKNLFGDPRKNANFRSLKKGKGMEVCKE